MLLHGCYQLKTIALALGSYGANIVWSNISSLGHSSSLESLQTTAHKVKVLLSA